VIFVDSSAVVAMIAREPEGPVFADKLEQARDKITAGHVILESCMRLSSMFDFPPTTADSLVADLLRETATEVVPITEEIAHIAAAAFERYGKGRGKKARLNFGDCLSYACAKAHGAALLFKGNDFAGTDIVRA
jgi:ribonuclease VapC